MGDNHLIKPDNSFYCCACGETEVEAEGDCCDDCFYEEENEDEEDDE